MDVAPTPLQTARLRLQPLRPDDAPALFPLFHDPAAMPYWHTPPHASVDDTRAAIDAMQRPPHARWWTLRTAADPARAIGFLGFLGYAGIPGFGYAVHADHRSQGYVREAARAALDHGFRQQQLDRVELWIHEANLPSQRVAESLGFVRRGCFRQMYPREGRSRETWVYGATRARWLGRDARADARESDAQEAPRIYGVEPVLAVADVAASARFYAEQLGFTVEYIFGEPASHAGLFRGEWSTQGLRLQLARRGQGGGVPSGALYLQMAPGLDRLYEDCRRKGVPIAEELEQQPWGRREFAVRDPDGYLLRFGEPA